MWKGSWLIKFFQMFDMSIRIPFRRYSRSKSKVVRNRSEFGRFLALPNFGGRAFQKLYAHYHPCFAAQSFGKVSWGYSHQPEVIEAHTLNFKPTFKFSRLNFFLGGTPSQLGCALEPWSISSACKNVRAQHIPNGGRNVVSRKMSTWVGQYEPLEIFSLRTKVHQLFRPTWKGLCFFQMFVMSIRSGDNRDQSKVVKNRAEIWTFLALPIFWGRAF